LGKGSAQDVDGSWSVGHSSDPRVRPPAGSRLMRSRVWWPTTVPRTSCSSTCAVASGRPRPSITHGWPEVSNVDADRRASGRGQLTPTPEPCTTAFPGCTGGAPLPLASCRVGRSHSGEMMLMGNARQRKRNADDDRSGIWTGYGSWSSSSGNGPDRHNRSWPSRSVTPASKRRRSSGAGDRRSPHVLPGLRRNRLKAVSRSEFEPSVIPGLLQTAEYARAILAGHCPPLEEESARLIERVAGEL
jgi:hypothetical protein